MEEIVTKLKRWGNSYGVLVPKKVIERENFKEDAELVITLKASKTMLIKDLIALAKKHQIKSKKSTEETIKEMDYELYGIKR